MPFFIAIVTSDGWVSGHALRVVPPASPPVTVNPRLKPPQGCLCCRQPPPPKRPPPLPGPPVSPLLLLQCLVPASDPHPGSAEASVQIAPQPNFSFGFMPSSPPCPSPPVHPQKPLCANHHLSRLPRSSPDKAAYDVTKRQTRGQVRAAWPLVHRCALQRAGWREEPPWPWKDHWEGVTLT